MDPKSSRETLDHSIMYIFAVALKMVLGIMLNPILLKEHKKSIVELWVQSLKEDPKWLKNITILTQK